MRSLRIVRPVRTTTLRTSAVRTATVALAAVGAGVLLAACASSATPGASSESSPPATSPDVSAPGTPDSSTPAPTAGSDLMGSFVWVSDSVTGQELVPDSQIVITRTEDRIGVTAGCNSMGATVVDNGDSWEVGEITSTMMGCSEPLMAQDTWVAQFLEAGPTVERSADTITLTSGDVTITFTERVAPSLTDTAWTLTGIITDDAVSSLPLDAKPATLTIVDGQLSLAGICNGTGGDVTIEGDTLTVELGMSTLIACGDDIDAAEQHARDVLGGVSTFTINDQQLTITKDDGTGLSFVAAGPVLPDDMETMPSVVDDLETMPSITDAPESFPESPMTSSS